MKNARHINVGEQRRGATSGSKVRMTIGGVDNVPDMLMYMYDGMEHYLVT